MFCLVYFTQPKRLADAANVCVCVSVVVVMRCLLLPKVCACMCVSVWIEAAFTFAFVCDYCYYPLFHVRFVWSASFRFILLRTHIYAHTRNIRVWLGLFCLFGSNNFRFWMMATLHNRHMHVCNWTACMLMWTTHTDSDMALHERQRQGVKLLVSTHTSVLLRTRSKSRWRFTHAQTTLKMHECRSRMCWCEVYYQTQMQLTERKTWKRRRTNESL